MVQLPIYMDNHSTTRTDPRVLEAMLPYFSEHYGNAASRTHVFGWRAADAVDQAREQIAALIGADKREIIFTSGATESNNLAIKGAAAMLRTRGRHIVTARTEHKAVLDPCTRLEHEGFEITFLPVDAQGRVTAQQVAGAITEQTVLVSIMTVNNEVGSVQPIQEIGRLCKEREVLFHTDAAQAAALLPIQVEEMGVDLMSLSAHKMYGPKGVGALYVRRRNPAVRLQPILDGGGHERGLRSGTLPVPLIVGFGLACELCQTLRTTEVARLQCLRERLHAGIAEQLDEVSLNGHPAERHPGNLNLSFAHVQGEALLMALKDVAVSSGSACTSASVEPSYVLRAMGVSDALAHSSIRFGLGRYNTEEEVDYTIDAVVQAVNRLRAMSPEYALREGRIGNPSGQEG